MLVQIFFTTLIFNIFYDGLCDGDYSGGGDVCGYDAHDDRNNNIHGIHLNLL